MSSSSFFQRLRIVKGRSDTTITPPKAVGSSPGADRKEPGPHRHPSDILAETGLDSYNADDPGLEIEAAIKRYASTGWEGLKLLLRVLKESSDGLTPLKAAIGGAVALIDIFETTKSNSADIAQVAQHIDRLMLILASRLRDGERIESTVVIGHYEVVLSEQLKEACIKLRRGWFKRVIESTQDRNELIAMSSKIADAMQELQLKIGLSVEKVTGQILEEVVFQNLARAEAAAYSAAISPNGFSRRNCTLGTRVEIIDDILAWALNQDDLTAPVYWVSGLAGQGKTTIAYTICDHLKSRADEVSTISFFCSSQLDSAGEKLLVSTLAFELAESSASYASKLLSVLRTERNLSHQRLDIQMRRLFVEPWASSSNRRKDLRPTVIVLDAIDENEAGIEFTDLLLSAIRKGELSGLRILITSRPSPELSALFGRTDGPDVRRRNLNHVSGGAVHQDIITYLRTELPEHADRRELHELADVSAGLFIYAATARRIVRPKGIRRTSDEEVVKMRQLTTRASSVSTPGLLDDLYKGILDKLFTGLDVEEQARRRRILLIVMCHSRPLTIPRLSELAEVTDELVQIVIEVLYPVLYIGELNLVLWHHASFRDYILATHTSALCTTWAIISRSYWTLSQKDTDLATEVEVLTTLFFGLHPSEITESNASQKLVDAIALPLLPQMLPNDGYVVPIIPNPPSEYAHSSTSHKRARAESIGKRPKSMPGKGKAHRKK
ncbi:hypothetical protein PENSPDRAFT_758105 [Peniophora sp. CONT]|nr:hypothetical protein PENSPDRAFT_758105 [Peniophora sp. CONT]